jgi:hypothetical protein
VTQQTQAGNSLGIDLAREVKPMRYVKRQLSSAETTQRSAEQGQRSAEIGQLSAELEPLLPMGTWLLLGRARTTTGHEALCVIGVNEADVPSDIRQLAETRFASGDTFFSAIAGT